MTKVYIKQPILELTALDVEKFFLKSRNYFTPYLPPYFDFTEILDEVKQKMKGRALAEFYDSETKMEEVEGDISLKASSGGVKLLLPKELSFELEVKTGSGNIHTDYDNNLSYNKKGNHASGIVGAEATCRISAEAGSGSVRVEQNL